MNYSGFRILGSNVLKKSQKSAHDRYVSLHKNCMAFLIKSYKIRKNIFKLHFIMMSINYYPLNQPQIRNKLA